MDGETLRVVGRASAAWLALLAIGVSNGFARGLLLSPRMSDLRAHQVSSLLGSALIFAACWWLVPWVGPRRTGALVALGLGWMTATVAFEFAFGRLVGRLPWSRLLADYDVTAGRLWPLVLATIAAAPLLVARARGS